jgi:hypothetical protein
VMVCSGIHEDPVAKWTVGSSVPYLLQRVLLPVGDSRVDTSSEGREVAPQ